MISIHALCEEGDLPCRCSSRSAAANFYPRPLRGGRHIVTRVIAVGYRFLSTPSARRATRATKAAAYKQLLFLSTPSARRATNHVKQLKPSKTHFYPRPPRGGRRLGIAALSIGIPFLSTPSARRATRTRQCACKVVVISIHALREEGDDIQTLKKSRHDNFYPRPPRGGRLLRVSFPKSSYNFYPRPPRGGRPCSYSRITKGVLFLSTPSARRATCSHRSQDPLPRDFYPRPPRGGRPEPACRTDTD